MLAGISGLDRIALSRFLREQERRCDHRADADELANGLRQGRFDFGVTEMLLAPSRSQRARAGAREWAPAELPRFPVVLGLWKGDLTLKRAIVDALDKLERDGEIAGFSRAIENGPRIVSSSVRAPDYASWRLQRSTERVARHDQEAQGRWNHFITIVIFGAGREDAEALPRTFASLLGQRYRNFEVLVVGLPDFRPEDADDFFEYRGLFVETQAEALDFLTNPAIDQVWRGTHIVFARAGTQFDADAFELLNLALNCVPGTLPPQLVLCDHDRVSPARAYSSPTFLPGWDPDLLQSRDYIETAFMASRDLVVSARGAEPPRSLYDWLRRSVGSVPGLRVSHIAEILIHIPVHVPRPDWSPPVVAMPVSGTLERPSMTVIIPNRNKPDLLAQCLRFLEFSNRFIPEVVIVDNASDDPGTLRLYDDLRARHGAVIVPMNAPFNFSRMINLGVAASRSEVMLLSEQRR